MENQTPRIAVAIGYKKAFREWLKSLPGEDPTTVVRPNAVTTKESKNEKTN